MPLGPLVKSVLKAGIEDLPDVVKAESVPNLLKKKSVKEEELKFSGIELPKKGKVTKKELVEAESKRKDVFGKETVPGQYQSYSLKEGQSNPTYRENVYTYAEPASAKDKAFAEDLSLTANTQAEYEQTLATEGIDLAKIKGESRYTSEHFQDVPNYLMHTRTYADTINGKSTHVVQEIQSDLHQQGRQMGYGSIDSDETRFMQRYLSDADFQEEYTDEAIELLMDSGYDHDAVEQLGGTFEAIGELAVRESVGVPESPYKTSWLRKGIEREITTAIAEGKEQIAIPISGDVKDLVRGEGVQKWYETKVLDTAKKVAKANDMDFEVIGKSYGQTPADINRSLTELKEQVEMQRSLGVEYEDDVIEVMYRQLTELGVSADDIPDFSEALLSGSKTIAELTATVKPSARGIKYPEAADMSYQLSRLFESSIEQGMTPVKAIDRAMQGMPGIEETAFQQYMKVPEFADLVEQVKTGTIKPGQAVNRARRLARAEQVQYAIIKPKGTSKPGFSLYATPTVTAFAGYTALKAGYRDDEVVMKFQEKGHDEAEAKQMLKESKKIQAAVAEGYSEEEVRAHLDTKEPKIDQELSVPTSPVEPPPPESTYGQAYRDLTGNEELSPKDLVAKLEVVYPNTSFATTNVSGFFGNEEHARIAKEAADASHARIIDAASQRGLQLELKDGDYWAQTEEGPVKVTPEWWKTFWEAKGELVLGTAGAVGGAYLGAQAGLLFPPTSVHPVAKAASIAIGSILGAALGASGGTELDYLHSAIVLQEDMNSEIMARKALTAAEISVVADSLILGGIKVAGKSWRGIVNAKEWIRQGAFDRARVALKEHLFIDDAQATEFVTKLSKVATVPGKNQSDREIAAAMLTQPGGEGVVKASATIDAKASAAISKAIDVRAQDLLKATSEIGDENIGRVLKGELEAYTSAVKENYARVKAVPGTSPRANNFKFNYDKIAIDPILETLNKNITDPTVAFQFTRQAEKIRDMSSTRSFSDLLELRQLVNDFKFNKRIRSAKDFGMLNDTIKRIDGAIEQGAYHILDRPKDWLDAFAEVRLDYAKMKQLEKNQLIKIVNRPGVSEKVIGQALAKYAYSLDDTFVDVLASMPKQTRGKVEGSVIESLANKYTAGIEGGQRATNFPMLAKDLQGVTFTTPDARALKRVVTDLSEIFMNDIPLAQSTGNIQVPKFQSFLTADPVIRAKFEVASSMFNSIKAMAPGSKARSLQLVKKTAAVLENPVNSKAIKELVEEAGGFINIDKQLEDLVSEAVKRKAATGSVGMPRAKFYGDGKVLSTKGSGKQQSIPVHRIATVEEVQQIAEVAGINRSDKKAIAQALKYRGYSAMQIGAESIRLLD